MMISINQAQQQLQDLIDSVNQSHQPIIIAEENSNAVLLSESDWKSIQETLYLGFAEKVSVCEYPQFLISDKEKCNCFKTPFAKTLHLLVLKIRETPINKRL
ncbi:type II toxin-antitoxin system Phd/YefM family antitoxin [Cuspidothrix issatschenkoi]|uniref:type II toxin-antitoxin system Phd/YefM family antitoxin n=1 Tax=Cuspidothrix issatschenkoi TaxID=230752 RepID=UPI001FAF867E|nr:type II toxin-antitoxin system Phd/YefM family antitoxin [Cuspidothrix issatschenkoi]